MKMQGFSFEELQMKLARKPLKLGILFSLSGSYGMLSRASRRGALRAIDAVNADDSFDFTFDAIQRDPAGNISSGLSSATAVIAPAVRWAEWTCQSLKYDVLWGHASRRLIMASANNRNLGGTIVIHVIP